MLQPCRRVHQFVRLRQLETVAERIGKSERHIAVAETGDIPRIGIMRLGAIEQDADMVMFLYREEYYKPDSEKKGQAELIIAKQRSGPTGTVELAWLAQYTKFGNLERESGNS